MEANLQSNFNVGFTNMRSDILIHLTQWQYWWWFWFSLLWAFYYLMILKMVRFRSLKFRPRVATTFRPHGKWGDLIVCIIPVSWCANIITNSNFILRMIEWQSESGLLTVRIRGKQWYWVYKFELKTFTDVFTIPKNIGHNKWQITTPGDVQVADDYLHILQLRSQNRWVKSYWEELNNEVSKSKDFNLVSPQERLKFNFFKLYDEYYYYMDVDSNLVLKKYTPEEIANRNFQIRRFKKFVKLIDINDFDLWPENGFSKIIDIIKEHEIEFEHFKHYFKKYLTLEYFWNRPVAGGYLDDYSVVGKKTNNVQLSDEDKADKHSPKLDFSEFREIDPWTSYEFAKIHNQYGFNFDGRKYMNNKSNFANNKSNNSVKTDMEKLPLVVSFKEVGDKYVADLVGGELNSSDFGDSGFFEKLPNLVFQERPYVKLRVKSPDDVDLDNTNFKINDAKWSKFDADCLKKNEFFKNFLLASVYSVKLPASFFEGISNVLNENFELYLNKNKLQDFNKIPKPKKKTFFTDFIRGSLDSDILSFDIKNISNKLLLEELNNENLFVRLKNKKKFWDESDNLINYSETVTNFLKNDNLFLDRSNQVTSFNEIIKLIDRRSLENTLRKTITHNYADFSDFDRSNRKSQGTISPLRLIKYPVSNKTNFDLNSNIVELFRFRFNDEEFSTRHRIAPNNSNFLIIRQKRYKRRKTVLPRTLYFKDSEGNLTKKVKYSQYTFLSQNKIILENDFNATKRYKFFKKNKIRDELTNLVLSKRMLRTRRTLVLPAHLNITAITNSFDVIHSWFIPGLGLKMDAIPGRATHHTFYIDNVGFYYGQCAEICGRYHHHMPIRICALPFEHFLLWWQSFGLPKLLFSKNFRRFNYSYGSRKYIW